MHTNEMIQEIVTLRARMTATELLDFLDQEDVGLEVGMNKVLIFLDRWIGYRFCWHRGSDTVSVYLGSENVDCFTMNNATLSDVLRSIKEYRTNKG